MKIPKICLFLFVGCIAFFGCNGSKIDPAFNSECSYKHDFYSSKEDCKKLNPNSEVNCSEIIIFRTDGKADVLLGGSDIMIQTTYKRKSKTIEVTKEAGMSKEIVFKIVSDIELINEGDNTKWMKN